MFASWGRVAFRRRWIVIIAVLLLTVIGGAWGAGVSDKLTQGGYDDPGSQAAQVDKVIEDAIGKQGGDVVVLYTAPASTTVDDPALAAKINAKLAALPAADVSKVVSYWNTHVPALADASKTHGLATITLASADQTKQSEQYAAIADKLAVDGVQTQIGGQAPLQKTITDKSMTDVEFAEIVSLPIVLLLLVVIFGSVVAALMPVLVGGLSILGALGVLRLISLGLDVNTFAVNVASLLGLGLAIDYGLFTVGRFREELAAGRDTADAVRRTVATAGRTVAFSATLLVIALAGLMVFPLDFLKAVAYGGMSAVAIAAIVSLTLLPALLAVLGPRIDRLAVPWRRGKTANPEPRWLNRVAGTVMKRPALFVVPIVALLLVLGGPFLNVRFGAADEKQLPPSDPGRQAIEAITAAFPSTGNSVASIVLRGKALDQAAISQFVADAGKVAADVHPVGAKGDVYVFNGTLPGDPLSDQAKDAVDSLRALPHPAGAEVLVGGFTAKLADSTQAIFDRLPWMALILVGATLLLMFLAFGSILLPIKAVVMSALSLSATFGVLTFVFQEGHGAGWLDVTPQPMQVGVMVLIGAVVFGLSTDYETFLLSRMVEARNRSLSTQEAVRTGLVRTGRMISAAALLLILVTGAFGLSSIVIMRFIGVGMIVALVLDATVVRLLLVPAVLRLLGNAAWWAPGPLRRLQERVGIQETDEPDEDIEPAREPELVH
ncbi:MMPL family transporter [Kutzneria sp. NPDC052558]|uniref:MMPL family transporter n=1 Tax=Kutzneria sp. NPDC052558 TaxID=3364121 RepID=UPI0037C58908